MNHLYKFGLDLLDESNKTLQENDAVTMKLYGLVLNNAVYFPEYQDYHIISKELYEIIADVRERYEDLSPKEMKEKLVRIEAILEMKKSIVIDIERLKENPKAVFTDNFKLN